MCMKRLLKLTVVLVAAMQLTCCRDRFSSVYTLQMPQAPEAWISVLGQPHWRVDFLDKDGNRQSKDILPGQSAEIELPITWTNPVTAWPNWPSHNLFAGFFKPAGALFPFDVSDKRLLLSWEAGVDTVFYWELALKNDQNLKKIPANFDWLRFRELFKTDMLSDAVCKDPWLVDWSYVAEKTIDSNFDRRRLVPQAAVSVNIPVSQGPWYGTSPFVQPLYFTKGETPVFSVHQGDNMWISSQGILRCTDKVWAFTVFSHE